MNAFDINDYRMLAGDQAAMIRAQDLEIQRLRARVTELEQAVAQAVAPTSEPGVPEAEARLSEIQQRVRAKAAAQDATTG